MTENSAPKPGNDNNLMTTTNTIGVQDPGHLLNYFEFLASSDAGLNPLDIHQLVEQQISVLDHKEIVSIIVELILSGQKEKNEVAVHQQADHLTGLPDQIQCLKDFPENAPRSIALVHINNMFEINDHFGRDTGDKILLLIAETLNNFARDNNVNVYRLESTNFCIVFKDPTTEEEILEYNDKLNALEFFHTNDKRIHLSIALGMVLDEPNIQTLLRHANVALRKSKKTRRNH